MNSIEETPIKRRKLDSGISQTKTFDSEDDSGDDLFHTIDTLPLPRKESQSATFITQPTQLVPEKDIKNNDTQRQPVVQVAGSSPTAPTAPTSTSASRIQKPASQNRSFTGGILASAIAPPGTTFRLPQGVSRAPAVTNPTIQEIQEVSSDEDVLCKPRGDSSDDDTQPSRTADIKPSLFKSTKPVSTNSTAAKSSTTFQNAIKNSFYNPSGLTSSPAFKGSIFDSRNRNEAQTNSKIGSVSATRSSDTMANAYGSKINRPPTNAQKPASLPAKVISRDMDIDDIKDLQVRKKVERMRNILSDHSVLTCFNALIKKKGNQDDAVDFLMSVEEISAEPPAIDLTLSDKEDGKTSQSSISQNKISAKPSAKQQLKAPNKKIHEKWTASQNFPTKPVAPSSPTSEASKELSKAKPKRRLVQGRKKESFPISSPRPTSPEPVLQDSGSDSGIDIVSGVESDSEGKLLDFFNKCDMSQFVDTAAITSELASIIISQRPFTTLDDVRDISDPVPKGKKKTVKKAIGEKVVDKCREMLSGYQAIDQLADRCEELGISVQEDMKSWGINLFGCATEGEFELADLDAISNATRDSGIGTPNSRDVSADEDVENEAGKQLQRKRHALASQPGIMSSEIKLKDYQILGMNWLALLFGKGLSAILADDMGLGKTCQVIAFLAHLMEKKNIKGPHLVIVPASTLENWLREFKHFCPELSVMPYYANQKERPEIREQIEENRNSINVIVTTYTIAKLKDDNKFLRRLKPVCTIYDEGHVLRNSKSAGYEMYMRIPCDFRLLLTGTPLQNNLAELASLLGFILPSVFREHSEELEAIFRHKARTTDADESHAALLSAERVNRAKRMMTPFVLRRKKHQVLKHLPKKHRRVQYCGLSASQVQIYESEKERAMSVINARESGLKTGSETSNVMMALRKASIHPLLFRRLYDDETLAKMSTACLMEPEFSQSNPDLVFEDMTVMTDMELHNFCERYSKTMGSFRLTNEEWMDSGKVTALGELLREYKAKGDRVLIFSQFVMVLNILEAVMETLEMQFFRLDGSTKIDERQDMLDQFYKEPEITVFLLSTGAGGAGINLACANRVIIFDSCFNPQMDIQAENRAHRVGQTREVEVVRLVSEGTIEVQIHALGETKLALDERVAGNAGDDVGNRAEKEGEKMVTEMMMKEIKEGKDKDVENGDIKDQDEVKEKKEDTVANEKNTET